MKVIQNTILTIAICGIALFLATDGLKAFTSEGERRYRIEQTPLSLPRVQLTDSAGKDFYVQDLHGQVVLVDFIFTNCNGICPIMTNNFQSLQKELQVSSLKEEVVLLTVSFDPKRDTQQKLSNYADAVGANTKYWKFANVSNKDELQLLLDVFGIVVIPAENGQFEHNGAIHLIDRTNKLAKIYDYESIDSILYDLRT